MKVVIFSICFFYLLNIGYTQNSASDIKLIEKKKYNIVIGDNNHRDNDTINNKDPIHYRHNNIIAKYNPFSLVATTAMLFYQYIVSPQFFKRCLYERSCSNFSKKAINEFGLIKGVFMSADRLLRCNAQAINDIPPDQFDESGLAIDEPSKYHWKKKR
jgi:putative component of membrane protein insertase Oxa1/YidC/SpoIIIJ protein YidD